MFGPLLGVGDQLGGQALVLLLRPAARPRPRQRPDRHAVALHAHHDLRRRPHQTKRTRLEVKEERAGVDDAEGPVNVEGPGLRVRLQALAQHDLEGVAGLDVLDALRHAGLERGRLEVGAVRPRRLADRGHVGQLQVGDPLLQPLDEPVHLVAGGLVAAAQVGRIDVGVRHGRDRLVDVVEDDHAVVEGEAEVGQAAVVGRRVRQPFHITHGVIGGVADGAAAEARQAGNVRAR